MFAPRRLLLAGSMLATLIALPALAQTPAPAAPTPPAAPAATAARNPAAVLATVNGQTITERDYAAAEAELAEAAAGIPEAQRREQIIDYLVTMRVISAQARTERMAEGPDNEARIRFATDRWLMENYIRREMERAVSPAAILAFYNERIRSQPTETEVRARHILVENEAEATAILAQLRGGANFEALAKEKSKDPGSGQEGGDLGFFTRERMVPEFATAAFEAAAGQLVGPVRTQFGWHVIRVEEKRETKPPELAEVEDQIRQFISRQAQTQIVTRLRTAAQINRPQAAPATPGAPAAPTAPRQ
jgi:peptidyl-prolyl cis-trans isomerase C